MSRKRLASSRDLWIVMGVALVARLVYFFINSRTNPAFDFLIMDSMHIDRWARAIAAGDAGNAVYFRGPLVPYLIAALYKMGAGVAGTVLFNHIAGVATCAFVWLLAREYFSRAVALTAGLVAALYWPLIYFEGEVLIEPVFITLVALTLWRLARAMVGPTAMRLAIAGACLGLAALARPTILALLPVLPFAFAAARASGSRASWLRPSLIVTAVCAAVLVPATVHNYRAGHALFPVTWSGSVNFYIGNNALSDGRSSMLPGSETNWMGGDDEAVAVASRAAGDSLGVAATSRFYSDQALEFFAQHPREAVRLTAKKIQMFWEGPERSNEKFIYFFWDRFGLGRFPMPGFWLVAPLALAAMVRLWSRRRELSLLYLFVLAYSIGVIAFFVVARYRLPIVPVLIVFAAWAAVDLADALRARRWKTAIPALIAFLVAFVIVNVSYPEFSSRRDSHMAISHYTLAGAYSERGNDDAALVELVYARDAFERAPSRYYAGVAQDIYFKLGTALYQRNKCSEAIKTLGQVSGTDPRAHQARVMFAECCEKTGRFHEAGKAYEQTLQVDPNNVTALRGLIRCLESTGQWDRAADARKRLPPDEPDDAGPD